MNEDKQIDSRKALRWLEGDEVMFAKIKTIFMKNVPSQVELLKSFLDTGNNASVENVAHTIMGSSAMVGANVMSEEAGKIEQSAIENDIESARLHFTRFFGEYEKIMAELAGDGGK
jgi:HPt (histidine-containing phosphotransfer) domain-containing protein